MLEVSHSTRFVDKAPATVYAALVAEGTHHCSIRTMYRILQDAHEIRERRNQLRHPNYRKPELLAAAVSDWLTRSVKPSRRGKTVLGQPPFLCTFFAFFVASPFP